MNGIINVYKPCGITSFDVVRNIKKLCKTKKVGHTGTLDPLASGVLPVCIGKGTKVVDYIMNNRKVYVAELKLGMVTDTYDREGKIVEENSVDVDENDVVSAINSFVGEIEQIPPMYSALKVNGKKLYELARQGIEVERQARNINIYRINILSLKLPYAVIEVECSKGTYIRSLCYDIGRKLGCGAVMWNLERTATGNFNKCRAVDLDKLNENNIDNYIIPLEKIFIEYKKICLNTKFGKLALNGVCIMDKRLLNELENEEFYRVYINDNIFIGLGKKSSKGFKIEKLLI